METNWDLSGRDVVPDLRAVGKPADVGAAMLFAMLRSDGDPWVAPYDSIRANLQIRSKAVLPELQYQADSRIRTYKTLFRGLGLLYDQDSVLHTTVLGKRLLSVLESQYQQVDDLGSAVFAESRGELARLVAPALARYQLSSPLSSAEYPPGTDIRPLLAIWRAMRQLDNKLHWEELGRALTSCLHDEDLGAAIQSIRTARETQDYDPRSDAQMTLLLGPRKPDLGADQSDRLDTWFSRAGFKGLLLEPRDRPDGYRYLADEYVGVIDHLIANPPEFNPTEDAATYASWIGDLTGNEAESQSERSSSSPLVVTEVVERARRFGGTHIIALSGPAGTGKTSAARDAAFILADGDPSRIRTVQFHAGFSYEEFVGGLAPVNGTFQPVPGVLVEISDEALTSPTNTYVLVIDELSRADVANVLGELLTYIEYRGRAFRVPSLGRDVVVAPNLIILATLNPSDRSVVNLDDALIRRLRQISIEPDPAALAEILKAAGMSVDLIARVVEWFGNLPRDTPFGHGVFVGVKDEVDLFYLWHESLRFFLWRGGLTVYADAETIERGYVWRLSERAALALTVETSSEETSFA